MKKKIKKNRVFGIQYEETSLSFLLNHKDGVVTVNNISMNAKLAKWLGERLIKASKALEQSKK